MIEILWIFIADESEAFIYYQDTIKMENLHSTIKPLSIKYYLGLIQFRLDA